MKVLLKKDVDILGYAGDVCKVAPGYARNFLIPRGLAEPATVGALKKAEAWRDQAEARRSELLAEHDALAEKIKAVELEFTAKAGDSGRLYGSITTMQLAEALNEKLGTEIDRRKIDVAPLRDLGQHKIGVRLGPDHKPQFTVNVLSEGGVIEAALEAAAAAEAEAAEMADAPEAMAPEAGADDMMAETEEGIVDTVVDTAEAVAESSEEA